MAIRVQFDKDGWYHPAFGRLGRGDNAETIYSLPDQFGERETVEVPLRDPRTKLPTGDVRKMERFKFLPRTATIIDDDLMEQMREDAEEAGDTPPPVKRPKMDPSENQKVPGKGTVARAQSAQERTTGQKKSGGARRAASGKEA